MKGGSKIPDSSSFLLWRVSSHFQFHIFNNRISLRANSTAKGSWYYTPAAFVRRPSHCHWSGGQDDDANPCIILLPSIQGPSIQWWAIMGFQPVLPFDSIVVRVFVCKYALWIYENFAHPIQLLLLHCYWSLVRSHQLTGSQGYYDL